MRTLFMTFFDQDNYGLRCLASCVQAQGHEVHILQVKTWMQEQAQALPETPVTMYAYSGNLWLTNITENSISPVELQLCAEAVARWKPDLIGISIRGVLHHILPPVVAALKQACPHAFLVGGGIGPTLNPDFLLGLGADAVIRGEGEEALVELIDALEKGTPWRSLRNIAYTGEHGTVCNPLRPLPSLDQFPLPLDDPQCFSCIEANIYVQQPMDRTAFPLNPLTPGRVWYVMTSRGCIGKCSYCSTPAQHRLYVQDNKHSQRLRVRSLASVMAELERAKQSGATRIMFHDDFFIRPAQDLHNFFVEYKQKINLPFIAYFHPQQLRDNDMLLKSIVDAGIMSFYFGIQNADNLFSKEIYCRSMYIDDYKSLCEKIRAYGVNIVFHFIGGNPLETEMQFIENAKFISQFPHDPSGKWNVSFISYYLQYYEGADLSNMFPGIESLPHSPQDWWHKSALLNMVRLIGVESVMRLLRNGDYAQNVAKLDHLRQCILRDKHMFYLSKEVERLQGKEVYFWGYGEMYHYKKFLFQGVKPRGILVDTPGNHPSSIDGIKVCHPDEVLDGNDPLPIVIFGKDQNTIHRKILAKYPAYTDVVSCATL